MKQISLKESQTLLLDLAKAVRDIANRHEIPFFMLGGTMLGAIRHKGFIPWDDDMDFGVTYDHFFELVNILNKELPERYHCLYFEDDSPVHSFFFKVEDSCTVIDDPCLDMPLEKKIGLSIDIFPIVSCSEAEGVSVAAKVKLLTDKEQLRVIPQNASFKKKVIKRILNLFNFGNNLKEKRQIKAILDGLPAGDKYCNIVSPQFWKIIWSHETFSELDTYSFENSYFLGPKNYDAYLSICYKDYIQLPPEEKRRAHTVGAYLRDDINDKLLKNNKLCIGGG